MHAIRLVTILLSLARLKIATTNVEVKFMTTALKLSWEYFKYNLLAWHKQTFHEIITLINIF